MTLDENRPTWEHARLKQDHVRPDYGPDDGSSEAEEAMFWEGVARRRESRLAGAPPHPDERLFGWRDEDRYETALWPKDEP